jgi:cob(I)alamin adenosyltransferase
MSIVTKTGDDGTTGLMYNRRVSKAHARVDAYGTADELNAALGMARAAATENFLRDSLVSIQKELVILMGELATLSEDKERYLKDGFSVVTATMTAGLEKVVKEIESQTISFKGWATPGANTSAAALDMARTVCRRAERRVRELSESGESVNAEILVYLNRLSDLLWLMARWAERGEPQAV